MDKLPLNSKLVVITAKQEKIILFFILLLGCIIRFFAAYRLSLSNDELSALTRARYDTFSEMISKGVYIDFHPAGIQSLIFYWIKLFGDSQFVFRLPFVLSGVFSIYLIFVLGKKWFSSFTGLFSAAVFSVFQFSILYSFFARPYSPGLFFVLLIAWAWTQLFFPESKEQKQSKINFLWITFTISMIAAIHSHYFSLVFAAGVGLTGFFFMRKEILKNYFISGIIILLSFIPEWNIFSEQIKTGDIGGWLGSPGAWYLPEFFTHVFNDSELIALTLFLLAIPGLMILIWKNSWTKFHAISIGWFLFSFLLAYLYSIFRHPVIQFSTLYFTFPFLLFILGSALEQFFSRSRWFMYFIPLILLVGTLHTLFSKGLFRKAQYGVFSDIADKISEWQSEYGKENVKTILNVINPEYMEYYFRKKESMPEIFLWKVERKNDLQRLQASLDTLNAPYICFAWSNSDHPFEIIRLLRNKYPIIRDKKVFFNSAAYLFSKNGKSVCPEPIISLIYNPAVKEWKNRINNNLDNERIFTLDSSMIFGPGFNRKISDIEGKFRIVSTSLEVNTIEKTLSASLVISYDSLGIAINYHSLGFEDCLDSENNWRRLTFTTILDDKVNKDYNLNIYIYNQYLENFRARNFKVTIEEWDNPYLPGE